MENKTYTVRILPAGTAVDRIDWNAIPAAPIDTYLWLEGYTPAAEARLVYIEDMGFVLRMTCAEQNPKAVYKAYNEPVYTDSCLEFFADWLGDGRYVNMEMNARGALLSCVGADRHARVPIRDLTGGDIFPVVGRMDNGLWSVTAVIPCDLLKAILGVDTLPFGAGYTFRGNFYKCGDETPIPHYGMWNPVGTANPDFHRPEFFGTLIMA